MDEYILSYTAQEIDEKLGMVKEVPTKVSQLENDAGYLDVDGVDRYCTEVGYLTWDGAQAAGFRTEEQINRIINAAVGDIETALDAIITIQNELIGGDGV